MTHDAWIGLGNMGGPMAAVRHADAVFTMLSKGERVRSVFDGPDGIWAHARQDALLCDASTVDVETSRRCHAQSAERGFVFADTPVSGGISGGEGPVSAPAAAGGTARSPAGAPGRSP